jgi:Flp pilus assembly pilin Flp
MESVTKVFIRASELSSWFAKRGQTMTEYALIWRAIAVVTYAILGNNIGSFASGVDSTLTNA